MVIDNNTEFEWFDEKNRSNIKDHHISFEEAVRVFADEFMLERYDAKNSTLEEDRYIGLGALRETFIVYVVYTERGQNIRLISAREAEPKEVDEYNENYRNSSGH